MGGGLTGLLFTFALAVSGLRKNTEDSHQPGGNNDEQNIPATSATMAVNPRQATSPTPSSKTSKPSLRRRQPARVLIGILSISLLVVGIATVPSDSELGYTFVAWGGGTFLTYLVVDVLLLREDRGNWKVVKDKAVSVINSELEGIRIDTLLFSGSEDLVITIPDGLSEEQETRFFAEEHLNEARRLSNNLEALKGRGLPNILNVKGLFDSRADKLASFQNRYWSRLLEPDLMAYLVDLEARLRRVDTSLEVLRKYQGFPEPTDELRGIREWEISSSWETLYRDMQSLLSCVLNGVDRGIIPKG
jgi:hypothetical protein